MGNSYPLLSPGVAFREFDFSQYAERLSTTIFGVVGRAAKGKVNDRNLIANPTELVKKLGYPNPAWKDKAWYAMEQFLKIGNQGVFVRVINLKIPNEAIGSGNGSLKKFTGTLTNSPITPSTIDITYPFTGTHHVTDNGLGRLVEAGNDIGSIDYQTGDFDIGDGSDGFLNPPESGTNNIHCSYSESGISQAIVNDGLGHDLLRVSATSPGTWADTGDTRIQISIQNVTDADDFDFIVQGWDTLSSAFVAVESYHGVSLDPTSDNFVIRVINEGRRGDPISTNVVIEVLPYSVAHPTTAPAVNNFTFAGGDDGIDCDAIDYAGTYASQTGVYAMSNSKILDLNLVAVPGVQIDGTRVDLARYHSIIVAMDDVCRNIRRDCFYLVDPPLGYNREQVIAWRQGANGPAKDTSYGALYWPWVVDDDVYNNVNVILPPSGYIAQRYAYNDAVAATWFAPAGLNRGVLNPQPLGLQFTPTDPDVDYLYDRKANCNVIVPDPSTGFTVWGQRTLQNRPTKLDRVNVRRMLLYLEKVISTSVRYLVFEPNDDLTWTTFINLVTPYVEEVKRGRGLDDVKVICDSSTTDATAIDRSEMYGKILLKPTGTAEFLTVDFNLYSSGAKFSE
jgi:hypothetical protein